MPQFLFNRVAGLQLASSVIKKETLTGVFLRILQNFKVHIFCRTPPSDCFWISNHVLISPLFTKKRIRLLYLQIYLFIYLYLFNTFTYINIYWSFLFRFIVGDVINLMSARHLSQHGRTKCSVASINKYMKVANFLSISFKLL